MAIKLTTTAQAAQNGIKAIVYGLAGAGKTTLARTAPEPIIIISAEGGMLSLHDVDLPVIEVSTMDDVHEAYSFLTDSDEAKGFRWVMLDSISEIAEVVLNAEKKIAKDPRQAYGAMQEQMADMVRAFRDLPDRHVLMTAKMERIKDEVSGAMLYSPSMPGTKMGPSLPYYFDEVFALRVERDADGQPTRAIQTQSDFQYVCKDRSGKLEMYEEPNLAVIAGKILNRSTN